MAKETAKKLAAKAYLAVWRWHFWAGLLITPVLVVIALTGALYVFKPQLEPLIYRDLFLVQPKSEINGSLEDFQAAVERRHPGYYLAYVHRLPEAERSWEGFVRPLERDSEKPNFRAFYDPYTASYLGHQNFDTTVFRIILDIHRNIMAGLPGRLLVETVTCWGIISVLSGLYLWWPRKKEKLKGVWIPRLKASRRILIRDLHAVPAMWLSLFLLLLMLSGLLFTRIWGTAYLAGNAMTGGFPDFYTDPPHSEVPETAEMPDRFDLDEAFARAQSQFDFDSRPHEIAIPPPGDDHAIQVITDITKPWVGLGSVFLDAYSGKVLDLTTGADMPWRTWFTLLFYPVHTGQIGGLVTQILALVASLALIGLSLTGVWMWWRRRPAGTLGAPGKPPPHVVPKTILIATILLAIFLPTVGITLIVLFVLSLVGKYIPIRQLD